MSLDKATGPDGFSAHFYKRCWHIIKLDLVRMIHYAHYYFRMGGSTNSTFLSLIPKEAKLSSFSRFRPISLCNVFYKIISKIIANQLKPFLPKLISPNQGGFVEKRHIIDNIILVQVAIHSSKSRGEKRMIIKIDMANTFDRVRHNFLCVVLRKFGLGDNFINWIFACIGSPWIALSVNGRPTTFLKFTRGLRQGFPPSPILYILLEKSIEQKIGQGKKSEKIYGHQNHSWGQ